MQGVKMLRALVLGGALSGFSHQLKALEQVQTATAGRGKGKGKGRAAQVKSWFGTRTASAKTRNPNDPAQAYLIARAEAKRARRAVKLQRDAGKAWVRNPASGFSKTLGPFYIAQ
jgi:hypothetical protein